MLPPPDITMAQWTVEEIHAAIVDSLPSEWTFTFEPHNGFWVGTVSTPTETHTESSPDPRIALLSVYSWLWYHRHHHTPSHPNWSPKDTARKEVEAGRKVRDVSAPEYEDLDPKAILAVYKDPPRRKKP